VVEEETMQTISIEDAQARLPELISELKRGDEITITQGAEPVARLIREGQPERAPRQLGTLKGSVLYMAPDFDAPLDDFREYME
jgi:antitoxin (DNA-binding transcriptional repressor) of toxin-antitoxin stability system